jgi:hypothetical protein
MRTFEGAAGAWATNRADTFFLAFFLDAFFLAGELFEATWRAAADTRFPPALAAFFNALAPE